MLQSRRDQRFTIPSGATVEFDDPNCTGRRLLASLFEISVAGLGFESEDPSPDLEPGVTLEGATVRIGDCSLAGTISIRFSTRVDARRMRYGGFFYPTSARDEERLTALIAGIETVLAHSAAPGGEPRKQSQ